MKIINQTKGTTLAQNASLAKNIFTRAIGLLNRSSLNKDEALIIMPCNSIHTFFMRFPIDVIFVDRNNKVIKALSSVKPFRLSGIYLSSSFVIELPAGTLQNIPTAIGDLVLIEQ